MVYHQTTQILLSINQLLRLIFEEDNTRDTYNLKLAISYFLEKCFFSISFC